jgi:hypothetical protein
VILSWTMTQVNFNCGPWHFNLDGQKVMRIYPSGVGWANTLTFFIVVIFLIPYKCNGFICLEFRCELVVNAEPAMIG